MTTDSTKLRESHSTSSNNSKELNKNTRLTVTGPIKYEQSTKPNQFAFYPVETEDGTKGYISTAYIKKAPSMPSIHFQMLEVNIKMPLTF